VSLIQGIPNVELGMPITESSSVTWSFTDSSGNIYYRQQEVLITADSSAPVPVLAISAVPNIDFPIVDENVTEIIWTYQDSSGNSIFQTQKVILTKPVGCTAGNVTINDFQFSVTNEQCYDQNNGSISILAAKPAPYNVTVQKVIGLQSKHQFDDTLNVDKLPPGDYNVCINIEGFDIEICKTLSILAAENLEVMYEVNDADKEIKVSMTGGDEYLITLNGTTITTAESELVLDLEWGTNELTVQTENECQDDFELSIETSKDLSFFPNPVSQGPLNLSLKGIPNRPTEFSILQLVIDVAGFTPGTYIVKAVSSDKTYSFTFIKI